MTADTAPTETDSAVIITPKRLTYTTAYTAKQMCIPISPSTSNTRRNDFQVQQQKVHMAAAGSA